jgi:hypothetical protein
VDLLNPLPTSTVHSISDDGTLEHPDAIVLGNTEPSIGVNEISINYVDYGESYDRNTTIVDIYFASSVAETIQNDPDPKSMVECKKRSDWNKWKEAIEAELASLKKREVFSSVIPTPLRTFPVGFKWVFIRKRNENNEVVRYKARLVPQGFTQRPGIDLNIFSSHEWNYIPILDITGNPKASIYAVDGRRDCIFIWVTRFGHIYEGSRWDPHTK